MPAISPTDEIGGRASNERMKVLRSTGKAVDMLRNPIYNVEKRWDKEDANGLA